MPESASQKKVNLYPLLYCAAAFATGILLNSALVFDEHLIAAAIIAFSAAALFLRNSSIATVLVLLTFFCGGAYCSLREADNIRPDRVQMLIDKGVIASSSPVEVDGTLDTSPEPSASGYFVTIEVHEILYAGRSMPASGRIRLYSMLTDVSQAAEFDSLNLSYGTHIKADVEISREEQYQNPGVASRIEMLDRKGIDATGTLKSPLLIENLGDGSTAFPFGWVYSFRKNLINEIRSKFSPSTAGVLTASMLGDKYFLDKPTAEVFRQGGTFHVLVISGLHITFIGGLLVLVAGVLTRNRFFRFAFVTVILWSYTMAVGAEAPVVRASLMFTIMMLSQVLNRQGSLLNSLGACVLILLALRPSDLFDPSLQLTLTSVLALVGMAFPLIDKLRSIGKWMPSAQTPFPPNVPKWLGRLCESLYWNPISWKIESSRQIWSAKILKSPFVPAVMARVGQKTVAYIFEGLIASLIVQIWLLPFLIIYFHRLSPISIVMNLWVGVVMALESFAAMTALALSAFSTFLGAPFFALTEFLNYLLATAPSFITHSQWSSCRLPNYSGWSSLIYIVYFFPVISLAIVLWRQHPFSVSKPKFTIPSTGLKFDFDSGVLTLSATCLLLICIVVFHPFSAPKPDGRLHVDFLDVGQGDSALVTFPDGKTMLVDGGGRPEFHTEDEAAETFVPDSPGVGESVVSPVLWNKGYSKIDYVLATHADADHIQGLTDVASNFQVGTALFGRMPQENAEFRILDDVLKQRRIPQELISRGKIMRFGDATVEVLYPHLDPEPDAKSDNNHSVVLRVTYDNRAFLLTGDIEQDAEDQLLNGGGILTADVIKVPHHGSRTSSTQPFVDNVHPEYAIISVGKHSRFGHPHKEVVDRWLAAGAKVTTTGEKGMVSVSTDGKDLLISSYR